MLEAVLVPAAVADAFRQLALLTEITPLRHQLAVLQGAVARQRATRFDRIVLVPLAICRRPIQLATSRNVKLKRSGGCLRRQTITRRRGARSAALCAIEIRYSTRSSLNGDVGADNLGGEDEMEGVEGRDADPGFPVFLPAMIRDLCVPLHVWEPFMEIPVDAPGGSPLS
jgi:hypothetical protein